MCQQQALASIEPGQVAVPISFTGLSARRWDAKEGFGDDREVRADVFVFAIQNCREPASYDALDIRQWRFHVVPARAAARR